jgi:hypothetical protein
MDSSSIIASLSGLWTAFLDSYVFAVAKFFLGVYVIVLVADIILLLMNRDLASDFKKDFFGTANVSVASRSKTRKKWDEILARLQTNNPSEYKVALLEADAMLDKILADIGYKGENMMDRLNQITSDQMEDVEDLKEAHQLRNQVVFERDMVLEKEQVERALKIYETVLTKMEFF